MNKLEQLQRSWVRKTRDNGEQFYCLKDDTPEWMDDLVREAHGTDMLPDDWRFDKLHSMIIDWQDSSDHHDVCDGLVDIYNHDLTKWLHSSNARHGFVDQARDEGLIGDEALLMDQLMCGQYQELTEMYFRLEQQIEELEEEE